MDLSFLYNSLVNEFKKKGIDLKKTSNGFSISYDDNNDNFITKLLVDFSNITDYNIILLNSNGNSSLCVESQSNNDKYLLENMDRLLHLYKEETDYLSFMKDDIKSIYELFKYSFKYSGNFGIGLKNSKDVIIKTDMEDMREILKEAGFVIDGKRITISRDKYDNVQQYLDKALEIALKRENNFNLNNDDKVLLVGKEETKSTVEYFEKVIRDANGEDIVVRLSIVKQNSEDTDYERLVNVSYFSKVNGNLTGKEIIGYENGDQFDKDVLPSIIDGFQKNVSLSGKQVQFSATNSTKCYLSNGEDDIYLDGYNVDGVRSLLDYNRTYGLVGDENDEIDFKSLYEDDLVEEMQDGMSFEGEVTDTKDEEEVNEESYSESLDGPRMVKKLGEMPTNNHGLTNSIGLVFYLAIDMIAIGVGLYLLMH